MRILTKRGLAQFQAGNKTMEECMASDEFSVEQTADMKVSTVAIPSLVEGEAAAHPAASPDKDKALSVADLTAQLTAANTALTTATASLETVTAEHAKLTTDLAKAQGDLTAAQAEVAVLKPVAVTGVRSLQIKLGRALGTSALSVKEIGDTHTTLSAESLKAFPRGQVSVAETENDKDPKPAAPDLQLVSAFSLKRGKK